MNVIKQFLKNLMRLAVSKKLKEFKHEIADPAAAQKRRLSEILAANKDSEYGKEFRFGNIRSFAEYQKNIPIRPYSYFSSYIDRMFAGEKNVLTSAEIEMFGVTSGTSAAAKYIPVTRAFTLEHHKSHLVWMYNMLAARDEEIVGGIFSMVSAAEQGRSPGGTPYGSSSGKQYRDQSIPIRMLHPVPYDVCKINDPLSKYYVTLAFALRADLRVVNSVNPSTLVMLGNVLNDTAEGLLDDLDTGEFNNAPALSVEEVGYYNRLFKAVPARAKRFREILRSEGQLLPQGVWNNLRVINTWQGGNAPFYHEKVRKLWGDIPQRCLGLRATEGMFSIPLDDFSPSGVLAVGGHFMEFAEDNGEKEIAEDTSTLQAHELEVGRKYRLVITTSAGLYRYDLGDIVEVTGMRSNTPEVAFLHKAGGVLSLTGEKVYEEQVVAVMSAIKSEFEFEVVDFTLTFELSDNSAGYLLLLELEGEPEDEVLRKFGSAFDSGLKEVNLEYMEKRSSGRLVKPKIMLLGKGSYASYRQKLVRLGKPDGQIKPLHLYIPQNNSGKVEFTGDFFDSIEVLRRID